MARVLDREQPNYFGAGPAMLPKEVLQEAALDLVNYEDSNLGVGEISHRSKPAGKVIDDTKANLKELLNIPDTHEVFFMQGGGTTGFSSIAYNMNAAYAKKTGKKGRSAYAVTGAWSSKAAEEAGRLGFDVDVVVNTKAEKYSDIPAYDQWKPLTEDTAYLFICDNETVNGNEFKDLPPASYLPENVELVADMSSNILSRKVDVSRYGLIMAGAQKNIGLAGLTIYIIKKSLLDLPSEQELNALNIPLAPIAFDYPIVVKNNSAYNTIPIFTCHILKLVTQKLIKEGGLEPVEKVNNEKAKILYDALTQDEFYTLPVTNAKVRSNMNVVFKLPSSDLEDKFVKQAGEQNLTGLKGHRSVGGMRASIYNAVTLESVQKLATFVTEFAKANK